MCAFPHHHLGGNFLGAPTFAGGTCLAIVSDNCLTTCFPLVRWVGSCHLLPSSFSVWILWLLGVEQAAARWIQELPVALLVCWRKRLHWFGSPLRTLNLCLFLVSLLSGNTTGPLSSALPFLFATYILLRGKTSGTGVSLRSDAAFQTHLPGHYFLAFLCSLLPSYYPQPHSCRLSALGGWSNENKLSRHVKTSLFFSRVQSVAACPLVWDFSSPTTISSLSPGREAC